MTSELTPAGHFTPADLDDILVKSGAIDAPTESFNRIRVDGPNFIADDNAWATPIRGDGPALICRIVSDPMQYQAKWFDKADADRAGRPEMEKQFCKSRFEVPGEAREYGTGGASCRECPFNPFERGVSNKCAWKGDIRIQPFPEGENPEITGDEPIYTLTMPTSAMFAWKGGGKPRAGDPPTFMQDLASLAVTQAKALWDIDPTTKVGAEQAVVRALGILKGGGVAAELRSVKQVNEAAGREWYIPRFMPIQIEASVPEAPAITAGEEYDGTGF